MNVVYATLMICLAVLFYGLVIPQMVSSNNDVSVITGLVLLVGSVVFGVGYVIKWFRRELDEE